MRQSRLALAAVAAVVGIGALGMAGPAGGAESPAARDVEASGVKFNPDPIGVMPGTEVVWHIGSEGPDGISHHIRLDDPKADCDDDKDCAAKNDSKLKSPGLEFRRVFEEKGEYKYHCVNHQDQGMVGIVYVNDEGQVPATQPPTTQPPTTQPPATQPPATQPPATAPPTTAPKPAAPATTATTKPPTAKAAGKEAKAPKPPKPAPAPTTTTLAPETTTTAPPLALPPLAEKLGQVPPVEETTTTTIVPAQQSGKDGFVAISKKPRRGGVKKATYAAVGALGLSLLGGGVAWWRRRPSRYWSA